MERKMERGHSCPPACEALRGMRENACLPKNILKSKAAFVRFCCAERTCGQECPRS